MSDSTLAMLREGWQRVLRTRTSKTGLAACPPRELHRMTQDVGLSQTDLRSLSCSHPGLGELMIRRLQELGLDPSYLKLARTAAYRDMERVCAKCKSWRRCARDLAKGDVQAGMNGYCFNAPTIDALTVDWPIPPRVLGGDDGSRQPTFPPSLFDMTCF